MQISNLLVVKFILRDAYHGDYVISTDVVHLTEHCRSYTLGAVFACALSIDSRHHSNLEKFT